MQIDIIINNWTNLYVITYTTIQFIKIYMQEHIIIANNY